MIYILLVVLNLAYAKMCLDSPLLLDFFAFMAMLYPLEVDANVLMWRVLLVAFRYIIADLNRNDGNTPPRPY